MRGLARARRDRLRPGHRRHLRVPQRGQPLRRHRRWHDRLRGACARDQAHCGHGAPGLRRSEGSDGRASARRGAQAAQAAAAAQRHAPVPRLLRRSHRSPRGRRSARSRVGGRQRAGAGPEDSRRAWHQGQGAEGRARRHRRLLRHRLGHCRFHRAVPERGRQGQGSAALSARARRLGNRRTEGACAPSTRSPIATWTRRFGVHRALCRKGRPRP
mmetsp:Transcript_21427/g.66479  ORF Transcript_21427/g.66479 Transcript_21427/m.66479 type:complete len:215 (+) Transcript_21427:499-1143(+)